MKLTIFMIFAFAVFQVSAETAYRSVDEKGNVTFSDKPVSGAVQQEPVRIEVRPPSVEKQQESRQREAELRKAASQVDSGDYPANDDQKKDARQALDEAEKRLEEAREVGEGDRIGTAGGGSRLRPEYHERVLEAEAELERAREELKGAR